MFDVLNLGLSGLLDHFLTISGEPHRPNKRAVPHNNFQINPGEIGD